MKKKVMIGLLMGIDAILINIAYILAFYIRFDGQFNGRVAGPYFQLYIDNLITVTMIKVGLLFVFGLYRNLWKYASIQELFQIVISSFGANTAVVAYMVLMQYKLPRSIYILAFILDVILIGCVRIGYRVYSNAKEHMFKAKDSDIKRVLVIGAGQAGALIIKELKNHENLKSKAVAVIDDDDSKLGSRINGVPILGDRYHIRKIVDKKKIDEIIIAIPSAPKRIIREIVEECSKTKCSLKIVPGIYEIIDGNVSIKHVRDVEIEDLLGREAVQVDLEDISDYLSGKVVLITGGGGSIGSELCRQISGFRPKKLLILDIYENNAYDIQNELIRMFPELDLEVLIASIRDRKRIEEIFAVYKPEVVFHAAAHKHVPLMEKNPQEAIKNNVFGTLNVAECAHDFGVKRFVLISTDKAVNPTNVMGATKRVAEMIVQSLNKTSKTEFVAVRFGNVLGSNGSVIPLFRKQIKEGGPVTVTHEEVTRYFMTIPEAVQLVIQAGSMAKGGEIFVLDMGEPVKIIDLARNLIRLSGFEPDEDIEVKVVGLRPGEKLYEELLLEEEGLVTTKHDKIFVANPIFTDLKLLQRELAILQTLLVNEQSDIKEYMTRIVPTYEIRKA
ncbi:polysaccharide biosynthesis protein [Serpentinicella alkaliphila]|uniref:FlaA1/EpsC-like NDP-sugar epimerase n=1 Tax=Serpentinicella alkaliphila TaxID=1734049 RepID=A0A4R2TI97_9FIRM|nr:nucleoside-diphosphate sugar epimerase/dehydratase [Serpentinicella alkaliphila]QUH25030.1 polysaccharide biosynthesis protein [Serpentinicella alkaliphila]TCQ02486.1 FlaA1/EpsC-like NDP-sugar epimerase [Serpentinicella alkaliphila]